jgi:hypothetical protein
MFLALTAVPVLHLLYSAALPRNPFSTPTEQAHEAHEYFTIRCGAGCCAVAVTYAVHAGEKHCRDNCGVLNSGRSSAGRLPSARLHARVPCGWRALGLTNKRMTDFYIATLHDQLKWLSDGDVAFADHGAYIFSIVLVVAALVRRACTTSCLSACTGLAWPIRLDPGPIRQPCGSCHLELWARLVRDRAALALPAVAAHSASSFGVLSCIRARELQYLTFVVFTVSRAVSFSMYGHLANGTAQRAAVCPLRLLSLWPSVLRQEFHYAHRRTRNDVWHRR